MLGTTLHHRFRLEQVLHRTPSGALYLATDERSGEMLAVKLFPPATDFAGEDGLRYRRAMERLAALSHPHLLAPRFTGIAEGIAFQVLPYYPADDLDAALAEGPLPVAQAVTLLRQGAQALAALHGAGLLHLNLKPSNVLISREEEPLQAVLCDPLRPLLGGLALHGAGPEDLACLAPEQVPWLDLTPDARSDLYALGALAFRALTGVPPFAAGTALEVLHLHGVARAPDPRPLNPEVPARLAAVVQKLLAKQPRERYQSAAGLLADLDHWDDDRTDGLGAAERRDPLAAGGRLCGRDAARETLLSALARAAGGQGTLVWLNGEAGSGRRSLLRDVLPHLEAARALVLRAAVPEREWCAPFHLPIALLGALLARWELLPDGQRNEILHRLHAALGENAAVLAALLPALRMLLPQAAEPTPLPLGRERLRTLHVLCEAFLALADARHPLVLWLEESQGADPDSQEWLALLTRRLRGAPALVVAGIVPEAGGAPSTWWPMQVPAAGRRDVLTIDLPRLNEEQIGAWLSDALGAGFPQPDRLAHWLAERSGGRPLALELALRLLLARGLLQPEPPAGWRCDWEALEHAAWPESLAALIAHRLELLPEGVLPLLQAVAAAPLGCTFARLGALLEHLPPPLLAGRVESALAEGVLRREGPLLRLAHGLLRDAVWRLTPPALQQGYHQLLGAALEAQPDLPPLQQHARTALHFRHGGEDERYVEHGCRLVAEAWRQQALHGLCAWAAHLQPLLHAERRLADVLIASGIAHAQLGNAPLALAQLGSARALGLGETDELEAIAYSAWAERAQGHRAEALALLEAGLARAGEALPANPVGTALARLSGAAVRRYEGLRQAALGNAPQPLAPRERLIAELLALASRLLADEHPFRAALADERILRLAGGRAPSPQGVGALVRLGEAEGDPDGAPFRQARAILERHAFPHADAAFHAALGRCRLARGQWRQGQEALLTALRGFQRLGALPDEADTLLALFEVARLQGPLPPLRQIAAALQELTAVLGDEAGQAASNALAACVGALAGAQPPGRACEALREAARQLGAAGQGGPARYLLALGAELALAGDDLGEHLTTVHGEAALPAASATYGAELLQAALAEGHLVQAALLPEECDHHLQQARTLLRGLGEGRNGGPRADLARVAVQERFLLTDDAEALRLAEGALAELDAQGLRLAAAVLRLRVAEGLKLAAHGDWMRWGGEALTAFDTLEAGLYLQAARRLLELQAPPQEPGAAPAPPAPGSGSGRGGGLAPLLERIAREGALDETVLQEALLAAFVQAGDAEYGAWFAPNRDGQLTLRGGHPRDALPAGQLNQWLAESVWQDGQANVLAHYRAPEGGPSAGGVAAQSLPASHSLLCVPVALEGQRHGVMMLGSAASRHVFDRTQGAALTALGREAAAMLALNGRLLLAEGAALELAREAEERSHRLRWAAAAAEAEDLAGLLGAWCEEAGAPQGGNGALLCLHEPDSAHGPAGLRLAATHGAVPDAAALAALFPLPLSRGQAEAALTRRLPVASAALDAPSATPAEQAILQAFGGGTGLWLPVLHRGSAFAVVLLVGERVGLLPPGTIDSALLEPLRLIAPALHAARRAEGLAGELAGHGERTDVLRREAQLYRRFLPPGLPARAQDLEAVLEQGVQRRAPVLVGEVPGLGLAQGDDGPAPAALLRRYFERVQHGLSLHQGTLARIGHEQWSATYPASVDGALWGAQTLYELLLELREEATAEGWPLPPSGLGLHLGDVLWSAVPAGDALAPALTGTGIRTAARLAAMSISFRCGILVSQHTVEALGDPRRFDLRHLGKLRPAPGDERIDVYELYSVRGADVVAPMRSLQGVWEEALREFQRGRWRTAAGAFHRYMERLPNDRPARYFLRQCRQRAQG